MLPIKKYNLCQCFILTFLYNFALEYWFFYHTAHFSFGFMALPIGHLKASENSSMLDSVPRTLTLAGG